MTKPGYAIERADDGLTRREREVLALIRGEFDQVQAAKSLGVTKQRVNQLVKKLRDKGVLTEQDEATLDRQGSADKN